MQPESQLQGRSGRSLAITLPSLTLITHVILFIIVALSAKPSSTGHDPHSPPSLFSLWNFVAAGASILGLIGAVRMRPALVSAYTIVHTITLILVTLALLNIVLPLNLCPTIPFIPDWHFDENRICLEFEDGFGWDEEWLTRCRTSLRFVKLGAAWIGLGLMLGQWWAVVSVWRWGQQLREDEKLNNIDTDVEKAETAQKKEELRMKEESTR